MSDLIDRQALLRQIDIDSEGEPGYYGDTWKFIDTIKRMPSALGTNLAEVGTDCISRQQAIEALEKWLHGVFGITEADGTATIFKTIRQLPTANCSEFPNNSDTISRAKAIDIVMFECGKWTGLAKEISKQIKQLQPAQPTFNARDTQYNLPIGVDCISRRAAIKILHEAMDAADQIADVPFGVYQNYRDKMNELPPAQPERIKGHWTVKEGELSFWDVCSVCRKMIIHRAPHYSFCPHCGAKMEREQDG